ncbi:MAG: AI-2E family transporter [Prochloraceae cyanobacterium]
MDKRPTDPNYNLFWKRVSTNVLVNFLLCFASGWALLELFKYFENVLVTFSFAAILAFLLNYPVRYLKRYLGRGLALGIVIAVTLLIIISVVGSLAIYFLNQLEQIIEIITERLNSPDSPLNQLDVFFEARNIQIEIEVLQELIKNSLNYTISLIIGSLSSFPNTLISFIFILVIAFFMLIEGEKLWKFTLKIIPAKRRERFSRVVKQSFIGFFRGQLIISIILTIATFLSFLLLKIPFALTLAIIMGLFSSIPGVGATLGVLTIAAIVLVQNGWFATIEVIVSSVILQQIQDNFISPRIMQQAVNLNPVIVFFALMVGARIAGLWGIFMSIPIAAALVSWFEIEEMQHNSREK